MIMYKRFDPGLISRVKDLHRNWLDIYNIKTKNTITIVDNPIYHLTNKMKNKNYPTVGIIHKI